jgi:2'-5' RNA ligase
MRLFVALDLESAVQQRLEAYMRDLAPRVPGVRLVRSGNLHITLKFLGEVPHSDEVCARLRSIRYGNFDLAVRGVGFFPNDRAPRVFWAGIESAALPGLAAAVSHALEPLGFAPEESYRPHLTLARNGSGRPRPVRGERSPASFRELARIVTTAPAPEFGTMSARRFFLYESRLSPGGASYSKLESFALGE